MYALMCFIRCSAMLGYTRPLEQVIHVELGGGEGANSNHKGCDCLDNQGNQGNRDLVRVIVLVV